MDADRQVGPADCEAGFTLVEVLVVLALVGLLTTALFGSIRFGVRLWERVSFHTSTTTRSLLVEDFLRRTVGAAYPFFVRDSPTQGHIDFAGTETSMEFIGPTPLSRGLGGRSRYRLSLQRWAGGPALVLTTQPELSSAETGVDSSDVLLTGVNSIELSYFGNSEHDPPQWRNWWRSDVGLPRLIRLRVNYARSDERARTEMVIAPLVDADVGCVYDDLSRRCRGR